MGREDSSTILIIIVFGLMLEMALILTSLESSRTNLSNKLSDIIMIIRHNRDFLLDRLQTLKTLQLDDRLILSLIEYNLNSKCTSSLQEDKLDQNLKIQKLKDDIVRDQEDEKVREKHFKQQEEGERTKKIFGRLPH